MKNQVEQTLRDVKAELKESNITMSSQLEKQVSKLIGTMHEAGVPNIAHKVVFDIKATLEIK